MMYSEITLKNGNIAFSLKIESISRKQLDNFEQAVAELSVATEDTLPLAILCDLSSPGIILTPYAKHIFVRVLDVVLHSPKSYIAIVAGTNLLATSFRTFLRLHLPANYSNSTIDIFNDNSSALGWLDKQLNIIEQY